MFTNSLKAEEKENNPWDFHSLYDLLYFNCPSCAYKNNSKQEFVNHAYDRHPKSFSELFRNIKDGSLDDIEIPDDPHEEENDFKSELKYEEEEETHDNNSDLISKTNSSKFIPLEIKMEVDEEEDTKEVDNRINSDDDYSEKYDLDSDICHSVFVDNTNVKKPKKSRHKKGNNIKKEYQCNKCEKTFGLKSSLMRHIKYHDGGFKKCEYCELTFDNKNLKKQHVLNDHRDQLCHKCEYCPEDEDVLFSKKEKLTQHINRFHTGWKVFACSNCSESFGTSVELKLHRREKHEGKTCELEKIQCEKCDKWFEKFYLRKHMIRVHDGGVQCQCEQCGKEFDNKYNLQDHVKNSHGENRQEACNVCGKLFHKQYLKQHIKAVHDKVKDFMCVTCGMAFSDRRTLREHDVTHTGVKNHHCDICKFFLN